jgi:hypothetical protein
MENNEEKIRFMLSQWFIDQNLPGMSPETTVKVAETCLLLDVAQVFLGYDNNEMAEVDDKVRSTCELFIKELEAIRIEKNKPVVIKIKEA